METLTQAIKVVALEIEIGMIDRPKSNNNN